MALRLKQKIFPHLWYAKAAEEAARFYASIFPNSRVEQVSTSQSDSPSGPPGSVKIVIFSLFGQRFQAMSAGPTMTSTTPSPWSWLATTGQSWTATGTGSSSEEVSHRPPVRPPVADYPGCLGRHVA